MTHAKGVYIEVTDACAATCPCVTGVMESEPSFAAADLYCECGPCDPDCGCGCALNVGEESP